jgi:protein transport protein SEC23
MLWTVHILPKTTEYIKIVGALGPCFSLKKKSPCMSRLEIGKGGTCEWILNAYDTNTTIAFLFDVDEGFYYFSFN